MNRRQFMRFTVLGSGAVLFGCNGGPEVDEAAFPPRDAAMDPGPLRSVFTHVHELSMHALVSADAAPAGAPALVLVHGSGLSGQYMIPTARPLADDFRIWVPDIPGYGDSGDPGEVLNVPAMADWLDAWMTAIDLPRASFLGNSFGCQVIADLAARYPQRVERALLQGPTTPPDERSAFWQFIRWRQNNAFNPEWLGDVTDQDYQKAGAWRLLRSFVSQLTDRIEDKAPRIDAPVLVIRGEHDRIAHQAFCDLIVDLCPDGSLHVVPDVAHTLVVTAPEAMAQITRDFVLG